MPTNREYLDQLASESPDKLKAWFDAEHVDAQRDNNGTCPIGNGTASDDSKTHSKTGPLLTERSELLSDEADSREKLEEDVWAGCEHLTTVGREDVLVNVSWTKLLGWLDRAADIREREFVQQYCAECETAENAALKGDIAVLRDRLDKLQAENDALMVAHADDVERLDAMGEGELMRKLDELQVELERMTDLYEYHKHNCDGWEESYDELSDENDRLNIELDKYRWLFDKSDGREKLEHDINSWLTSQVAVTVYVTEIESEVRKWLDRQANITAAVWSGYMADAAKQIDELHARLDHLPDERECEVCDRATMAEEINGLSAERDYWMVQVWKTLMCAGNYAPAVMAYPRPDSYTEPSTLVTDAINSLRDFHADDQRLIKKLESEVESYRKKLSHAVDNAHDTVMLMDEGAA